MLANLISTWLLADYLQASRKLLRLGMNQDYYYVKDKIASPANRGSWDALAKAAGVNYHWLTKFSQGRTSGYSRVGVAQIQKLAAYFRKKEAS